MLSPWKNTKFYRGPRILEYASWQKTKTCKRRESTESFLNQKTPIPNEPIF